MKRLIVVFLSIAVLSTIVYFNSPTYLRNLGYIEAEATREDVSEDKKIVIDETEEDDEIEGLSDYIQTYAYEYFIDEIWLEVYPVDNDNEFWKSIIQRDRNLNTDNRTFKIDITTRIIERNNNSFDTLFGIGYTSNMMYTERDYVYQYFMFGLFGLIILMGPYILSYVYVIIKILKNFKEKVNLKSSILIVSLFYIFVIAYFAGHVFGMLINMYFMSLIVGMLLKEVNNKNINKK